MLANHVMIDLSQEYCEILEEGFVNEVAYDLMKEKVRNEYDSEIWELVDSEDNVDEFDFQDYLNDIMDDIESRGNYYYDNSNEA